jgi:hypothetical protein
MQNIQRLVASSQQKSYAEVTSVDIFKKAVQCVVTENLKSRSNDDKADVSVMIFGLPESKSDVAKVKKVLKNDIQLIVYIQLIGKSTKHTSTTADQTLGCVTPRPIKVELKCIEDKNWVLHNAKSFVTAYVLSSIRIAKCFTLIEVEKLKKTRNDYSHLNASSTKLVRRKNRFVVIDRRIMERQDKGALVLYNVQINAKNSITYT